MDELDIIWLMWMVPTINMISLTWRLIFLSSQYVHANDMIMPQVVIADIIIFNKGVKIILGIRCSTLKMCEVVT